MDIDQLLRKLALQKERGRYSYSEIAAKVGKSPAYISEVFRGKRRGVSLELVIDIAKHMGLTLSLTI